MSPVPRVPKGSSVARCWINRVRQCWSFRPHPEEVAAVRVGVARLLTESRRRPPDRHSAPQLTSTACGPREVAGGVRPGDGTIVAMTKDGRGSAGGRANEGGSVYRSSFGAYLIAYGLADHNVSLDAASPGVPHWLWFESDAPVDDLAVQFSSGARWDIQATARCDWDTKFRKTTAQWRAARSGRLQPGDRVGLAAAKLSQRLLDLRDAFRRVRDGGTFTPRRSRDRQVPHRRGSGRVARRVRSDDADGGHRAPGLRN